jgi:hypothetical protein
MKSKFAYLILVGFILYVVFSYASLVKYNRNDPELLFPSSLNGIIFLIIGIILIMFLVVGGGFNKHLFWLIIILIVVVVSIGILGYHKGNIENVPGYWWVICSVFLLVSIFSYVGR